MKKFFLIVICTFSAVWVFSLIRCEYLTNKHYDDFKYGYKENAMLGDIEYFKVLSCDGKTARVYYVGKDMSGADILKFVKDGNIWSYDSWYATVWSGTGGSASGVVWPYWWHFIYGGL